MSAEGWMDDVHQDMMGWGGDKMDAKIEKAICRKDLYFYDDLKTEIFFCSCDLIEQYFLLTHLSQDMMGWGVDKMDAKKKKTIFQHLQKGFSFGGYSDKCMIVFC